MKPAGQGPKAAGREKDRAELPLMRRPLEEIRSRDADRERKI
jgi:hypothetical protein